MTVTRDQIIAIYSTRHDQVNVPDNKEIGNRKEYGIQGFPTLIMFIDGAQIEYQGARDAQSLARFAKKALEPTVKIVKDKAEFDAVLAENKLVVSGQFAADSAGTLCHRMF